VFGPRGCEGDDCGFGDIRLVGCCH
jgi:hypothetical protein